MPRRVDILVDIWVNATLHDEHTHLTCHLQQLVDLLLRVVHVHEDWAYLTQELLVRLALAVHGVVNHLEHELVSVLHLLH